MDVISDIPGDSNDGDPNKNPRDESKKPQEQQVAKTRNRLPDELLETLFALLSRWHYPKLPVVCPDYRRVIASPLLYGERLRIGNTEAVLYALIGFLPSTLRSWYILNKTNGSFRLSRVQSLDNMPSGSAVVTIGFNMYVIGGSIECVHKPTVSLIDCRFHKSRLLPSMRRARYRPAVGVIDGKIYVIGGCEPHGSDWVEVFDVKTESWSHVPGPYTDAVCSNRSEFVTCAVMQDKIYVLDHISCFTYEPKKDLWETTGGIRKSASGFLFSPLKMLWQESSCVVDDVLFTIGSSGCPILAFDPKAKYWRPVRCRLPHNLFPGHSVMANFGGKLVVLGGTDCNIGEKKEIWCIVITLKKCQDGQDGYFTGTIERAQGVLTSSDEPYIEHCCAPTI